ncbi:peroxisomal membrane protein PMP34 isoform X2 [Agrilus planipennis]|uniref:Peroxisomal membrane protein PMP34 isoform X1 n=1 Tax=Agrilus planipennis TaxID=224129 RepID=A0A1W4XBC5_AGRPL|nr:peroxisomal membrane protein PMP34 isoform X1 [Agrilus planipennis]XP_025834866.1 peroxisomal membrane protein PMP34 isoform X2 [Agrilus planipennis]XP_025834867.1 peroxisomal membrane protein PMP34 isoform X2 [Agrilus planipennis]
MTCQSIFSYETWVHATAGSLGSMIAMATFYPLDTIRFRQQLADSSLKNESVVSSLLQILQSEGIIALYQGLKPVLISLGVSNFVYFYTFHGLKKIFKESAKNDLSLSFVAGVINVLFTTPLWVVNSRLKVSHPPYYSNLIDGLIYIANSEGLKALWSGLGPSLILVLNPALQFTIYEALKRKISANSAGAYFLIGACAKVIATVLTYPLQLAQTRQRYGKGNKIGMVALLFSILKRNGPLALFNGLEAKLTQTVLTAALMFMCYEKIVFYVFRILLRGTNTKKLV